MSVLASGYESPVTSSDEEETNLSIKRRKLDTIITNSVSKNVNDSQNNKNPGKELNKEKPEDHKIDFATSISRILPAPKNNREIRNQSSDTSIAKNTTNEFARHYEETDEETQSIFQALMKKSSSSIKSESDIDVAQAKFRPTSNTQLSNTIYTKFEELPIPEIIDPIVSDKMKHNEKEISEKKSEETEHKNIRVQGLKDGVKIIDFNVNDHYNAANSEKSSSSGINDMDSKTSTGVLKVFNVHGKNQFSSLATYAQDSKNNDILQEKFKREKQHKWKNKQKYGF